MENTFKQIEINMKSRNASVALNKKIIRIKLTELEKKTYGGVPFTDEEIRKAYARAIIEYAIENDIVRPYDVEDFLNDCFEVADQWRISLFENIEDESTKSDKKGRYV